MATCNSSKVQGEHGERRQEGQSGARRVSGNVLRGGGNGLVLGTVLPVKASRIVNVENIEA